MLGLAGQILDARGVREPAHRLDVEAQRPRGSGLLREAINALRNSGREQDAIRIERALHGR
jgi:hypothetical protein